mgnify:CR=1 FL=1
MNKKSKQAPVPASTLPRFAERLKQLRMDQNWSLRDCEKRTGKALSRQSFLRAEQGEVTLENLLRILALFKLKKPEVDELLRDYSDTELSRARASA